MTVLTLSKCLNYKASEITEIIGALTFRKLLLYPTELRRHIRSNLLQMKLNCSKYCMFFKHDSWRFSMFHVSPTGKPLENQCASKSLPNIFEPNILEGLCHVL
jgi:hypothetical protein